MPNAIKLAMNMINNPMTPTIMKVILSSAAILLFFQGILFPHFPETFVLFINIGIFCILLYTSGASFLSRGSCEEHVALTGFTPLEILK